MSCSQFYRRPGTFLSTPTSQTFGIREDANNTSTSSASDISSSTNTVVLGLTPVSRSLEQKVDLLIKSAQEQKG